MVLLRNACWLALASSNSLVSAVNSLYIDTTVGRVHGKVNESFPQVAQYLAVPFAEPPIDNLRFAPPVKKTREDGVIEATEIGSLCPQYIQTTQNSPSVYTYDAPWLQPYGSISEDCLTLDVYAPYMSKDARDERSKKLPILVWIFGGGFYEGGTRTLAMDPSHWVQRTQGLIVVAIKYVYARSLRQKRTDLDIVLVPMSSAFPTRRELINPSSILVCSTNAWRLSGYETMLTHSEVTLLALRFGGRALVLPV
jgi:acetylcholinesterase